MTIPDSPLKRQKLVILGGTSGIGAAVAYAAAARWPTRRRRAALKWCWLRVAFPTPGRKTTRCI